jgi:hypothetical protein
MLRRFGDTTYFLEQLMKGLWAKREEGTWNRTMTREAGFQYETDFEDVSRTVAGDSELPRDLANIHSS